MKTDKATSFLVIALLQVFISGCASMFQDRNVALVREPGNRTYNSPEAVAISAKVLWEYAVLSENVYVDEWTEQPATRPKEKTARPQLPEATLETYIKACVPDSEAQIPLPGWTIWRDFPSLRLKEKARQVGLFVEVWEKGSSPPVIAVVFRGTEATSWKDWVSNLRWILRFVPLYPDQYTTVAREVGKEVLEDLKKRLDSGNEHYKSVHLVSTGHSLGGGLAQHLAYSLPIIKMSDGALMPRVAHVYAFDPSPVTGWFSVEREVRESNAKGLRIDRIFEHGEILAYLRLMIRYINPPSPADPAIRETRYNFVDSINPFSSHSMRLIACALVDASGQATIPHLFEIFQADK